MDYREFIQKVVRLDFVKDEGTADAAVKAVLGILASRLKEPQARELVQKLPQPLTYEKLRSHQVKVALMITVNDYVNEIAAQFNLRRDQAQTLVNTVLHITKNALEPATFEDLKSNVSPDWAKELDEA